MTQERTLRDPFVWIDPADAVFVVACREALAIERKAYAAADQERRQLREALAVKNVWRPMQTARDVRDSRLVLLRLVTKLKDDTALRVHGGVIGHWWHEEREWYLANDWDDLHSGSGWGLIDDDFSGWKPLPDLSTDQLRAQPEAPP